MTRARDIAERARRRRWGATAVWALIGAAAAAAMVLPMAEPGTAALGVYRYVDAVRPQLAGALALAAFAAALRRRRFVAAAGLVLAVCAAAGSWSAHAPARAALGEGTAGCAPLRVATANLFEGNREEAAVWAALQALDADLLATAELTPDMADLQARLGAAYPWRALTPPSGPGARRMALWSRLPMGEATVLSQGKHPFHVLAAPRLRDGTELRVMALHLGLPPPLKRYGPTMDFPRFAPWFEGAAEGRAIVMGDFNATPWSLAVRRIADVAKAAAPAGWRPTWPGAAAGRAGRWLGLPIDQVLVGEDVAVRRVWVFDIPGSDHRGVAADLCVSTDRRG